MKQVHIGDKKIICHCDELLFTEVSPGVTSPGVGGNDYDEAEEGEEGEEESGGLDGGSGGVATTSAENILNSGGGNGVLPGVTTPGAGGNEYVEQGEEGEEDAGGLDEESGEEAAPERDLVMIERGCSPWLIP